MIQLGRMNSLPIIKIDEKGAWLDADDLGHVFVPQSQMDAHSKSLFPRQTRLRQYMYPARVNMPHGICVLCF